MKTYNVDVAAAEMLKAGVGLHLEDNLEGEEWARDDVTGGDLDPAAVRAARCEEMTFIRGLPLYEEASLEECRARTGKGPISTKWVDIAKGGEVRSRWVARDFKPKGERDRADLFTAMPPLEAKRMLFRRFAVQSNLKGKRKMKLMLIDVKKAHLNGLCEEDNVYVELPDEAGAPGRCGRLRRWLYGMRGAASAWGADYTKRLKAEGFVEGVSAPTVFYNPDTCTRVVVHGDDFTFLGYGDELEKIKAKMAHWYELKVRGVLGTDPGDAKKISLLNREIEITEAGLTYRADPKHAELIWEKLGLRRDSRGSTTAFVREECEGDEVELNSADATLFRQVAARANYLALDRPDIQFTVKEVCGHMAAPTQGGVRKLKHLARYLPKFPEVELHYPWLYDEEVETVDVYTDSDWAGCRATRKSTSGGVVMIGGGIIKTWSKTQGPVALSSGEAEYYSMVKGAVEGIGLQTLARDLGWSSGLRLFVDSSAAKAIASRKGLGKVRHLEVRHLWLQQAVREKRVALREVDGKRNSSDIVTKSLGISDIEKMLGLMEAHFWHTVLKNKDS